MLIKFSHKNLKSCQKNLLRFLLHQTTFLLQKLRLLIIMQQLYKKLKEVNDNSSTDIDTKK